jgi:hypothetical protein
MYVQLDFQKVEDLVQWVTLLKTWLFTDTSRMKIPFFFEESESFLHVSMVFKDHQGANQVNFEAPIEDKEKVLSALKAVEGVILFAGIASVMED